MTIVKTLLLLKLAAIDLALRSHSEIRFWSNYNDDICNLMLSILTNIMLMICDHNMIVTNCGIDCVWGDPSLKNTALKVPVVKLIKSENAMLTDFWFIYCTWLIDYHKRYLS